MNDCDETVELDTYPLSRRAPGYFTLLGDKVPPSVHDSSEVIARA